MISYGFASGIGRAIWTSKAEGDMSDLWGGELISAGTSRAIGVVRGELGLSGEAILVRPRQIHSARVSTVDELISALPVPTEGDAVITNRHDTAGCILTADCLPLSLCSNDGRVAAVHAGWAGLVGGVIERAVSALRESGDWKIQAAVGPYIRHECYEFRGKAAGVVRARFGEAVFSHSGAHLDLGAVLSELLASVDVELVFDCEVCTSCDDSYFSHRARNEPGRQMLAVTGGRCER